MLCRLEDDLPIRGDWVFEPKWDGFRGLLAKDGDRVRLHSRNAKDLGRWFPEVVSRAKGLPDCVLDGELVALDGERQDFELLQMALAGQSVPVAFIAFDLPAVFEEDLRETPFSERRARLVELSNDSEAIQVTPQTSDRDLAETWLESLLPLGFEGVVAKKISDPYLSGVRAMVKVKHRVTADLVVGGYTGPAGEPRSLLLGAYDDKGVLHNVGATTYLPASLRTQLALLTPLRDATSFNGRPPELSRWQSNRYEEWTAVEPLLVAEVSYERIDSGRFRHAARFVRWRPDKDAKDCLISDLP
jgi:ATP-dependent DNA ligase